MKKIETGAARPETFPEQWPGQCEVFSHLEYACGIPSILYAVTTYKENGQCMLRRMGQLSRRRRRLLCAGAAAGQHAHTDEYPPHRRILRQLSSRPAL